MTIQLFGRMLTRLDAIVTGAEASNVVDLAKARA